MRVEPWYLALTPEFLDSEEHMVWAHRKACNNSKELDFAETARYLRTLGVRDLPSFLPEKVQEAWRTFLPTERGSR